ALKRLSQVCTVSWVNSSSWAIAGTRVPALASRMIRARSTAHAGAVRERANFSMAVCSLAVSFRSFMAISSLLVEGAQFYKRLAGCTTKCRYMQCKGASLLHRAGDQHLPAMHPRDVLHDREPETCPAALTTACLIDTVKTLKDPIEVVVRNADPLITHVDDQHSVVLACAHPDATLRVAVGNGVLEQIDDGLLEQGSVDR